MGQKKGDNFDANALSVNSICDLQIQYSYLLTIVFQSKYTIVVVLLDIRTTRDKILIFANSC